MQFVNPAFGSQFGLNPETPLCHKDMSVKKFEKHQLGQLLHSPGQGHCSPETLGACSQAPCKASLAGGTVRPEPHSATQISYFQVQCFFYDSLFLKSFYLYKILFLSKVSVIT